MRRRKTWDPGNRDDDARIRSAIAAFVRRGGTSPSEADLVAFRGFRYIRIRTNDDLAAVYRVLHNGALRRMKRPPVALRWRDPTAGPPIGADKILNALGVIRCLAERADVPRNIVGLLAYATTQHCEDGLVFTFPAGGRQFAEEVACHAESLHEVISLPVIVRVAGEAQQAPAEPELPASRLRTPSAGRREQSSARQAPYEMVQTGNDAFNVREPSGELVFSVSLTRKCASAITARLNARHTAHDTPYRRDARSRV